MTLWESQNSKLYDLLQKVLDSYKERTYIKKLFKKHKCDVFPVLKKVKVNKKCDTFMLDVSGSRCEIIQKTHGRFHEEYEKKKYTPVWFRVWLRTGFCYQKCFTERCNSIDRETGKHRKGKAFKIDPLLLMQIRNLTLDNQNFVNRIQNRT